MILPCVPICWASMTRGLCLVNAPYLGNLFETMVVNDFLKRFLHFGEKPSMYFLRSRDGLEIDLIIEREGKLHSFEIKSTMTIYPKYVIFNKQYGFLKGVYTKPNK